MKKFHIIINSPEISVREISALLETQLNLSPIRLSEAFRESKDNNTNLFSRLNKFIERGELIPSELTNELIEYKLENTRANGIQLIRYPRNKEQFLSVIEMLNRHDYTFEHLWYLTYKSLDQVIEFKKNKEKDDPYIKKFGFDDEYFRKRHQEHVNSYEDISSVVTDKSRITLIKMNYPPNVEELKKCITSFIK